MVSRTFVLELNVARLQGLLQGETPQERFRSFIMRLCQPEHILPLFQEYPILARQLVGRIDQWVSVSTAFVQRICDDWKNLRATFSPTADPGVLVRLDGAAGDRHRDG